MRYLTRCAVLASLLLTLAGCQKSKAPGKNAGPVSIKQVRVGIPHGRTDKQTALSRNGVWAPVYVTLKAGKDGIPAESYRLAIQSSDAEGSLYRFTVPVPALGGEEERVVVGYAQPGGPTSEFTPILERPNGDVALTGPKFERKQDRYEILEANDQLIFSIGSQLTGLEQTIEAEVAENANKKDQAAAGKGAPPSDSDAGRRRFAFVEDDINLLPDQWFGYDAVDLVVLNTRNEKWLDALTGDSGKRQRQALQEWVRRGGRLVLSIGQRGDRVAKQLLRQDLPLLNPDDFDGDVKEDKADLNDTGVRQWLRANIQRDQPKLIDLFGLKPAFNMDDPRRSPRVQVLLRDGRGVPLILQTSCGLGRVLVVLFDLDGAPFAGWDAERLFWTKILNEMVPEPLFTNQQAATYADDRKPSLSSDLQHGLEMFSEIPTTNFSWVALFVLFYILLVGPFDYFILKKVFKRMELTWLTFPTVVLVVSVSAYAIAYALKGTDLRIQKIDIVEFDLTDAKPRAYGNTWFTLFSPRIANFTVGLQPSTDGDPQDEGGWFPKPTAEEKLKQPVSWLHREIDKNALPAYPTTLALLTAPERTTTREGETSLYPRPYEYAEGAAGLERVPIPIWATRTFKASYAVPFDPAKTFFADLRFGTDGKPQGSITNHLSVGLTDVKILYGGEKDGSGKWYTLGKKSSDLPAGATFNVDQLFQPGNGEPFQQLFTDAPLQPEEDPRKTPRPLVKALFFFQLAQGTERPNSGLRHLDQSWRVEGTAVDRSNQARPGDLPRREMVLIGRVKVDHGNAENLTRSASSPTRVWLDHLPGTVDKRPALDGQLEQNTFIRVYLPIRAREPRP